MFVVVFSEKAEIDLNEIGEWYKKIRSGLDLEFLICVEAEIEMIRKAPLINKIYFKNVRKTIINRFPYGIYYLVKEKQVIVLSVSHHKRGKKVIKQNLKTK
jgi:toxin ParE1/3/4